MTNDTKALDYEGHLLEDIEFFVKEYIRARDLQSKAATNIEDINQPDKETETAEETDSDTKEVEHFVREWSAERDEEKLINLEVI